MMTNDHAETRIPLELTLDELGWLHCFLSEERRLADIDYENVESLHNDTAICAAQDALKLERAKMLTIVNKIDKTLDIVGKRESLVRKLAAAMPAA